MNHEAVQDWLKVRRELLEKEAAFTTLAIKVANAEESEEHLQQERVVVEGLRELCTAAYQRAFPSTALDPRSQ